MNFTDYINQTALVRQKKGSVLLEEKDFEYFFRVERDPVTDVKFSQIHITVIVNNITYGYVPNKLGVLVSFRNYSESVFRINPETIKKLKTKHESEIIEQIKKYM